MKRPQPDIGDILRASFINNMGSARKFKRLWGTTTVGGVEVLRHRQYYYPSSSRPPNFEKLFRFLGAYEDVTSSNPQGVRSAWLYINKNKGSSLPEPEGLGELSLTYNDFVAHNLNQLWWDDNDGPMPEGLTLTTSIVIEGEFNTTRDTSVNSSEALNPNDPSEVVASSIVSNYDLLWDTCLISQQGIGVINKGSITNEFNNVVTQDEDDLSPNDPWLDVIARYALRSDGIPCTILDVEKGYGKTEAGRLYYTYVVTLEIPYYSFSTSTPMVQSVVNDLKGTYSSRTRTKLSYPNGYYTKFGIQSMDSTDLEDDPTLVTRPYRLWEDEAVEIDPVFSNIWIRSGDTWYLKADVFDNPRAYGLTYKKLYSYVVTLIDSGYQKKKVKWWKKALAIVIFVVAVVFALPTGGASLSATALATAILVGALVVNLLALAFAAAGMHEWATAFSEVSKTIEPLVIIASIVTLGNTLNNIAQKASQEALEQIVTEYVDDFIDELLQGATELVSGQLTELSMGFASKVTNLVNRFLQFRLDDINSRNKDLQSEYEALTKEMNQEYDVLQGFMYIYSKPATADWSMYAATFDQPYERGGGPLALGNIQRTTKQALRKSKYDEPIFENILIV